MIPPARVLCASIFGAETSFSLTVALLIHEKRFQGDIQYVFISDIHCLHFQFCSLV